MPRFFRGVTYSRKPPFWVTHQSNLSRITLLQKGQRSSAFCNTICTCFAFCQPRQTCFTASDLVPYMAWVLRNFFQSVVSIHTTCNNLICCKTGSNGGGKTRAASRSTPSVMIERFSFSFQTNTYRNHFSRSYQNQSNRRTKETFTQKFLLKRATAFSRPF